ncbi:bactofilin family protein [Natronogracilivirga saccharolytica]|uniref:Polymer-forming cytoskeletal protein n=1 Tax=Natronogracilivirga saccharolytica TaxID=2812953 RepID=A0A8J7UUU9_9BACT|nr:polymer-forming cytoskeletal protein [Natronogracilivirga saccharolytica]MBP3193986.1 polymer-forming cytoskeletal protein [Natronogracilivirga saccharolytica]
MFYKKADSFWLIKDSVIGDGKMTIPTNTSIAGLLKMDIECTGKVVVAASGEVRGSIRASEVQIYGEVAGDITASEGLTIYKSGVVKGNISSKKLVIEEGAKCNFRMTVGEHIKPVLIKNGSSKVPEVAGMGIISQ